MSGFKLNILANRTEQAQLSQWFKGLDQINVQKYQPSQLNELLDKISTEELTIIWIDQKILRSLQVLNSNGNSHEIGHHLLVTGSAITASDAIQLGRLGFIDYYDIPSDTEKLVDTVVKNYESWCQALKTSDEIDVGTPKLVGESLSVIKLKNLVNRVAPREKLMVLVRGETGTGKGLVAKYLHDLSPRSGKPFVEINCTAIPDGLIESELFGHEKGAFTDAHKSRRGIFELANGGTLFLDEIGYLKPEIQVKLLKVLEDRRFRRVGGEKDIQVDCRIITGTSVDLEEKIRNNEFRKDLYYRLNVFPIHVPPLRDRGDDILRLAEHFRKYYSNEHGIETKGYTAEAIAFLRNHSWQGNVRELKHTIERAVILSDSHLVGLPEIQGEIIDRAVDQHTASSSEETTAQDPSSIGSALVIPFDEHGKSMEQIQKEVIEQVLALTQGNRSEAARLLNISRSRLLRRIASLDS